MKMAWRNPCRFFMRQKQSKTNSSKARKTGKSYFSHTLVTKKCVPGYKKVRTCPQE